MDDSDSKVTIESPREDAVTGDPNGPTTAGNQTQEVSPLNQGDIPLLQAKYGMNTVETGKKRKCYHVFFGALVHPFNVLLTVLAISSGVAEEFETLGIMMIMVSISTFLRFYQEWKSEVAVKSLLKYVASKVTVFRKNATGQAVEIRIASTEIVPGDWVKLYPGELVPADVEVLEAKDFHVSQAALTGEAIPVQKYSLGHEGEHGSKTSSLKMPATLPHVSPSKTPTSKGVRILRQVVGLPVYKPITAHPEAGPDETDLDKPDLAFQGTSVVSGTATCRVLFIGSNTHFGRLASELAKKKPQNAFQLGVRRISFIFFLTMICMIPPVLLMQGLLVNNDGDNGDDNRCMNRWCKAAFFALSVAVGLTPEMLPMIVSTALAKGAVDMSRKNCIVKQLDAIINMGGIDVLCTDKTGTLTLSVVTLNSYVNRYGIKSHVPLFLGYLNSYFQSVRQNPLDSAVISFFVKYDIPDVTDAVDNFQVVDEVPFDFVRRRISVILEGSGERENLMDQRFLVCKGAVEEVLQNCAHTMISGAKVEEMDEDISNLLAGIRDGTWTEPMNDAIMTELQELNEQLSEDGLRVIAVAYKRVPNPVGNEEIRYTPDDECEMTFAGLLAFLDPPKETSREAIEYLRKHNVAVKVLTGDSHLVCKKVCVDIGIPTDKIVTGKQLAKIAKEENGQENLIAIAEEYTIFAKLTPVQKSDIVRALKMKGHIVGFLGDGINDAPALSEADVGISVDSGADICKESANIILLEKDITVVVDGVVTGRMTYGNTLKYIVMTVSSNFGNVFSILVASAWLPFEPMASLHLLVQNLLYDISQIAIPWDHMDPEFLLVPHRWSMKSVLKFMVMIGPWSSVFDISTFAYMYFYFDIKTNQDKEKVKLFQTAWFTVGLLTQTLIVHMIRTPKIPFIQSWASRPVVLMTVIIMSLGLAIPWIPYVRDWLQMTEPKWQVYPFVAAVLLAYCIVAQIAKVIYLKLFKEWY